MKRLFLVSSLCLLSILSYAQAAKRAFAISDLYRLQSIDGFQVSPDAKTILYAQSKSDLPRAKRQTHVWMMDINGGNPRQITYSEKSESSPAFSHDGKWISFVSSRDGDESIYLMPANGGEARRLTKISTGISDPLWSPDGKWIAFATDVYPECGDDDACNKKISSRWTEGPLKAHMADELLYRHWTEWKDGKRTHLFLANVATGAVRDVTPGNFDSPPFQLGGALHYDFAPDSTELVFVSNHDKVPAASTNNDLWLLSLNDLSQPAKNITEENHGYDGNPKYSPDGRYIAYRLQKQPAYESDLFQLAIYDRSARKSRILTESFNNWVEDFDWTEDSKSIYFSGPVEGISPLFQVDLNGKISKVLAAKTIDHFSIIHGGKTLIFTGRSVGEPQEMYVSEISGGKASTPNRITHLNDAVAAEVDIRPAETIWVDGALGAKVQVFIVKPHNFDPSKKYPLILNVHGGPQSQWADAFRGDWQVYPGAGYVVAFANPHGSTGFGQPFTAQISGDFGGAVFEDLMKVTDTLEKLPYVDRNRIGAMGWSYGGYMMNWFEGHTNRFKAIASMMGIYDLRSFHGATEELWFPEWDLRGKPWDSADYEKFSPCNFVKNFKTPCLVISGERDYRCPYTGSLQFFTDLQEMNVPSRLIIYSNAGHWPSWYEMAFYYTAHLEWFQKYLGGGGPPWTSEQFLRNAVFDKATGERVSEEPAKSKTKESEQPTPQGKPDQKPQSM